MKNYFHYCLFSFSFSFALTGQCHHSQSVYHALSIIRRWRGLSLLHHINPRGMEVCVRPGKLETASASGQAFPDQADKPLDTAEAQGTLQSQILPIEFEMALLIRPHPVGEEGDLDVVHDGLFIGLD